MGIEPIATDRQSVMLAITPTNRANCMGDWIRTCNLFIPGEGSGQTEYSHIFKELKSVLAASHTDTSVQARNAISSFCTYIFKSIHVSTSSKTDDRICISSYMKH